MSTVKDTVNYINRSGIRSEFYATKFVLIHEFDNDFEPTGPALRRDLVRKGLVVEDDNMFLRLL